MEVYRVLCLLSQLSSQAYSNRSIEYILNIFIFRSFSVISFWICFFLVKDVFNAINSYFIGNLKLSFSLGD